MKCLPLIHSEAVPVFFLETEGKMSLGCQEAFEVFKQDHADSITIEDNKQLLKQR